MDNGFSFEFPPRGRELSRRRSMQDPEGVVWLVREMTYADSAPSLVFEGEGVVRRVRGYPANWQTLGDAELWKLSWEK